MGNSIEDPDWLPELVKKTYFSLRDSGKLTEQEVAFFTDQRLVDFWTHIDNYLNGVESQAIEKLSQLNDDVEWHWLLDRKENATGMLIGCFINGLDQYTPTKGISKKTKIRESQKEVDILIGKASDLAIELAETLANIQQTSSYCQPDELNFLSLVSRATPADIEYGSPLNRALFTDTSDVILKLGEALRDYPRAKELFADIPGMASQKTSWRDWLYCAYDLIDECMPRYEGNIPLDIREKHWVALVRTLFPDQDSDGLRDRVHNTLNKLQ